MKINGSLLNQLFKSLYYYENFYSKLLLAALALFTTVAFSQNDPVSISEIQETSDPSGDSPLAGEMVETTGIVTGFYESGFWIQDGSGAWNGIFVRTAEPPTLAVGDDVTVSGTVQENYGLTRLNNVTEMTVNSSGNELPAPVLVTTGTAGVEDYESVLIAIGGAVCTNDDIGYGEWAIDDDSGPYAVAPQIYSDTEPVTSIIYNITGIAYYSYDAFKLLPRGADDVVEVVITPIGVASEVDDQGVAVNLGEVYTVTGIVHGVNMNGNGLSITIIDETGGVGLYSPSPMAYEVTEGDSIFVSGQVDQYNGLTQLKELSPIVLVSQGHDLMEPIVTTELIEDYESLLVTIECVSIIDPTKWTTGTGNGGFSVNVTDGTNSFTMRINNDVELYNAEVPNGTFNLTGIVGQFTFDTPYLSGYQVLPRYSADIELTECGVPDGLEDINKFSFDVYPNPTSDHFFVETPTAIQAATLINVLGQEVKSFGFSASQNFEINVNGLDGGIYILQLRSVNNQISTTKVVVE